MIVARSQHILVCWNTPNSIQNQNTHSSLMIVEEHLCIKIIWKDIWWLMYNISQIWKIYLNVISDKKDFYRSFTWNWATHLDFDNLCGGSIWNKWIIIIYGWKVKQNLETTNIYPNIADPYLISIVKCLLYLYFSEE